MPVHIPPTACIVDRNVAGPVLGFGKYRILIPIFHRTFAYLFVTENMTFPNLLREINKACAFAGGDDERNFPEHYQNGQTFANVFALQSVWIDGTDIYVKLDV